MGSLGSRILGYSDPALADPHQSEARAGPSSGNGDHKRKWSRPAAGPESEDGPRSPDRDQELQQVVPPNHGKKVKIASECAYQTLFLSGDTSDIKICALGKVWCLHKRFLCQSGYFATMFRGSREGSHNEMIELQINDQNIDTESLHFVLGSLYRDQCVIREPLHVIGVLATAHLLQVEDLIRQCEQTMEDTISGKTVCGYYAAADTYGLDSVKTACFEWLLHHLMTHPSVELYKGLRIDLMNLLTSSANLFVMQKEIDVYTTLKEWMFLHLNPAWKGSVEELLVHTNDWFRRHRECGGGTAFLETRQGRAFQSVFKNLRFQHIICDLGSTRVIERDALIPSEWLSHVYKQQWFALLRTQQCEEIGPRYIDRKELEECSMRCGKMIVGDGRYAWGWSAFNFGFPLRVIFSSHYVIFKQNRLRQPCDAPACLQPLRNVAFRLTVVHFESSGEISFHKTTGYKILTLEKDEERVVMKLDSRAVRFPLHIFCNFLFISSENP
ncbi:germ cell-less protein-like 1 [Artibeus jamaicensis]|uniref:germ cell-less protein-like 1 n=1 Tax=Artibeus jamaicensis TaxID=9417 RepID=UPI00235AF63E|nr:germ cell-less protein-like 1 [Artibeus jamaicensis]